MFSFGRPIKKTTPTEKMAKILECAQFANIEKASELIIRKMQIKAKIHQRVQNERLVPGVSRT